MDNYKITNAVILAAGLGARLRPLTDEIPKCLTEINGQPMLLQTLQALEQNGVTNTVIVIGYFGQVIIDTIGYRIGNMNIEYIKNEIYDETNSSYSAWLASETLEKGAFVVEGDTIYDREIISEITSLNDGKSYWVVDQFTEERDGCMLITDGKSRIQDLKIIRQKLKVYKKNFFKSCGLLKLTAEFGRKMVKWLEKEVNDDNVKIYYDLVIEKHLHEAQLNIFNVNGKRWEEVDNFEDLIRAENIFEHPKHIIVLIDGAADAPQDKLEGQTPLEAAQIPTIDSLAKHGKCGLMKTMLNGLPIGSIVANMGILGYNPMRYYPNGRASFEALARDIYLSDNDIAFRCNIVTVKDGILTDFTAGNIEDDIAQKIISEVSKHFKNIEIYTGQSYRNLVVMRDLPVPASDIKCFEPHMNMGIPMNNLQVYSRSKESEETVNFLNHFVKTSNEIIQNLQPELRPNADSLFIWSPSSNPRLPSFHKKFGLDGAIVAAMDFLHGLGKSTRMEYHKIPGTNGYSNTDLNAKLEMAKRYLVNNDIVYIHVNAPDEESHIFNLEGKVNVLEKIDLEIVKPLKEYLDTKYHDNYRIAVLPDHYTYVENGKHDDKLVPYIVYGKGVSKDDLTRFSEAEINLHSRSIVKSYEFMNYFLNI
jgi:2,3-bisphosphoglycerate-independent phosphoglycerate mutase